MSIEIVKSIQSKVIKDAKTGKITSNDIALRDGLSSDWFQDQLKISLGSYIKSLSPQKLSGLAIGMVNSNNLLSISEPLSIMGSILQIANLGLSLDGFRGEAYLVPFFNSRKSQYEAKPMIGYRGLHKKLIDSGAVKKVDTNVYRQGDLFIIRYGDKETIEHEPKSATEPVLGAYAILWLVNGSRQFDRMYQQEIEEIRNCSKSAFDKDGNLTGPWKSSPVEMARKTVLRRLAKWASVSPDATKAAMIEEYAENANTTFRVIDGGTIDYRVEEEKPIEIHQPKRVEIQEQKPETVVKEEETVTAEDIKGIFDDKPKQESKQEEPKKAKTITEGQAKRLFAILNSKKKRTEEQLKAEILAPLGLTSSRDIPMDIYNDIVAWAEGKDFKAASLGEFMNRAELVVEEMKKSYDFPNKNFGLRVGEDWPAFVKEFLEIKEIQDQIGLATVMTQLASMSLNSKLKTKYGEHKTPEESTDAYLEIVKDPAIYESQLSMLYWGIKAGQRLAEIQILDSIAKSE